MYVLQILDWYCASMSVILVCICECAAFCWIYGERSAGAVPPSFFYETLSITFLSNKFMSVGTQIKALLKYSFTANLNKLSGEFVFIGYHRFQF